MGIVISTWLPLAVVGGLPAIGALVSDASGNWRKWAAAIVIFPYWMLILTQFLWPIGGLSNFVFNLLALAAVTFIAEAVLLLPQIRSGPVSRRAAVFLVVMLSTIPIHLAFPPMPD